ncbi:hypothetical protein KP509_19G001600 [Ceratopteris richardii]|uniref:Uncharacterized protein n=1 Tax=Ceratopteris richardii TaxID=49495 RepID=A0A8T2SHB7_CERRI|nr:hypothetical protein KP509_19G001600 [Ceratopteris richardii]
MNENLAWLLFVAIISRPNSCLLNLVLFLYVHMGGVGGNQLFSAISGRRFPKSRLSRMILCLNTCFHLGPTPHYEVRCSLLLEIALLQIAHFIPSTSWIQSAAKFQTVGENATSRIPSAQI